MFNYKKKRLNFKNKTKTDLQNVETKFQVQSFFRVWNFQNFYENLNNIVNSFF